jgi:ABC-type transport system involved in cytochrome c biogenesis permease subunit
MSNQKKNQASEPAAVTTPDTGWRRWAPWAIFGLFLLLVAMGLRPPQAKGEYDTVAFGKLPVLLGGRIKPMDSVARNSLLQIAGQQSIPLDGNGPNGAWGDLIELHDANDGEGLYFRKFYQFNKRPRKLPPAEWLMEVLMRPEIADRRFIFRIDLPELLDELKFETTGVDQSGLRFYSFEQLLPHVLRLHKQSQEISGVREKLRNPYQRAVFKLAGALHIYIQLRYSLQPNGLVLTDKPPASERDLRAWVGEQVMQRVANQYSQAATVDFAAELKRLGAPNPLQAALMKDHLPALQTIQEIARRGVFDPGLTNNLTGDLSGLSLEDLDNRLIGQFTSTHFIAEQSRALLKERLEDATTPPDERVQLIARLENVDMILSGLNFILAAPHAEQVALARNLIMDRLVYQSMASRGNLLLVPPFHPKADNTGWEKSGELLADIVETRQPVPEQAAHLAAISTAYTAQQPEAFNQAVGQYTDWLRAKNFTTELRKGGQEHYFNSFAPFARSMGMYLVAVLLAGFSWLNLSRWLTRSAFYLVGLALVVHTVGLICRMYLEGRPPVTNLYSSAVFVGWGAVVLGWILERIYRNGIGSFTAGMIGFATLIIARHLARQGDTMEMMQAVLDTNFWLATHVTCITIGYSATFLAGFLAIIYVIRGVFTPALGSETAKSIARMVYGIVCFATLFSFVGTVLGGIWADQSWGRFWGWDTKENGALLIVLWNILVLHSKWGGLVRERGLIGLVIFGNVVTAWSWFGVNMLGIGLHSYGFMDEAFNTLKWFAIGQVLLIGAAIQPLRNWLSGRHLAKEHNRPIALAVAAMMGGGILLHGASLWVGPFLGYLGVALVGAGLVLSFIPMGTTRVPGKPA